MKELVLEWALNNGITLLWPEQFESESQDFQTNVCIDYGKFIRRVPFFVLRPANLDQLVNCAAFLNDQLIPYKVRGAAHSSGGQVLTDNGAVIDLSGLSRILEDRPEEETILVEGGIWWLQLAEFLYAQDRRPVVMTDNLRTTVSGTLSVGGFGDTTHLYGLQIASVTELTLVTPNGQVHRLLPSDKLFRYALAGRGQLGMIAHTRLKTLRRTSKLSLRLLKWHSMVDYVEDAIRMIKERLYEFSRVRIRFQPQSPHHNPVIGVAGDFRNDLPLEDAALGILRHAKLYPYEQLDLFQHQSQDPSDKWKHCSPSVEIIFPLPDGLDAWQQINRQILESGLYRYLVRGSSVMVLRSDPNFPLAPLPRTEFCMLVALRPAMDLQLVHQYLPLLQALEAQALQAGAKIYLMSIEPEVPNFLEMEFGTALQEFLALKNELDPHRLLNPGLIP